MATSPFRARRCFNSCPRAEGNTSCAASITAGACFNSCPRAEGNHMTTTRQPWQTCFNSCPRAEGNRQRCFTGCFTGVSIRALARRATCRRARLHRGNQFQFVPSRGGQRPQQALKVCPAFGFNSCPRAEGNGELHAGDSVLTSFNSCPRAEGNRLIELVVQDCKVSIRALARRAT